MGKTKCTKKYDMGYDGETEVLVTNWPRNVVGTLPDELEITWQDDGEIKHISVGNEILPGRVYYKMVETINELVDAVNALSRLAEGNND